MEIEVTKTEKNLIEVQINNVTVAEVLRVYLQDAGVDKAVWRRDHPSKPAVFRIESSDKTVKKAVGEAISALKKDLDKISSSVKK